MQNMAVEISSEELRKVWQAYHTLERFLEKFVSPNELYQTEFLEGIQESLDEVQRGEFVEVQSFADFIGAFN